MTRMIPELIKAVENAFYKEQKQEMLDNVFLLLQQSIVGALEANGNNTMKLKHMSKAKLRKEEILPVSLTAEQKLIENSRKFLEYHCHVVEKAARISAAKKKAVEDKKEKKRLEAALRKEEKIIEAATRKAVKRVKMWRKKDLKLL